MGRCWKVLIADDEEIIRDGIHETIPWQSLDLQVVAKAEDGDEALKLALLHKVDILLVDLNMPMMDGITLIKQMREQLPACRIVIITGHDEFVYAQEAIRLGVEDYILKPVNAKQLAKVLESVSQNISHRFQEEKYLTVASSQIVKNLSVLRERFCLEWIEGNLSKEEIIEQLEFLQLPVESPAMVGVIRWFEKDARKPYVTEKDRQLYLYAIENIAGEFLQPWNHIIFRDHLGIITIFIWSVVKEEIFHSIEKAIHSYLKIATVQAFERVEGRPNQIAKHYQEARANVYRMTQLSPMVRRGNQYLKEHYHDSDLSLETLSEALQVSSMYLSRQFKEELGMSFVHVLSQIRIKKAIELLDSTELPIYEIADRVGFDNQHYFSTSFKKIVGVSPNQYRRGHL